MTQTGGLTIEVIVPYDQAAPEAAAYGAEFPSVNFLDLGGTGRPPEDMMGLYHLYTLRRAAGVGAARAKVVGMLTDRGIPAPGWAAAALELQRTYGAAAVGGCVANGIDTNWNWAVHFYDFARYMPPQETRDVEHISVTNACYEASALDRIAENVQPCFLELAVHESLAASGQKIVLSDRMITTEYRPRVSTRQLAREWFTWGRKYAEFRVSEVSPAVRMLRVLKAPMVPVALWTRQLSVQRKKIVHMKRFWRASPLLLLVVTMWALGEMTGYLLGPRKDTRT